jgi:senataxin
MKTAGQKRKHRAKVLVAAPSNAALDEIVLRLLAAGLRDEAGEPYSPTIVRAGLNAHHSVAGVTMDALVTQRMTSMARGGVSSAARAGSTGMERDRIRTAILDEAAIVRPRPAASDGNTSRYPIPRNFTTGLGTDKVLPCIWGQQ